MMNVYGSIRHENVAPFRAYYNSKEEKFVVYDYYNQDTTHNEGDVEVLQLQQEFVGTCRKPIKSLEEKLESDLNDHLSHLLRDLNDEISSKGGEGTPLDWETRLRIAIGTARGIPYIHTQTGGKLVHGNIKASNIFPQLPARWLRIRAWLDNFNKSSNPSRRENPWILSPRSDKHE
ncbi:hypothetical protein LguiA_002286 [Lonicera macranthoides]